MEKNTTPTANFRTYKAKDLKPVTWNVESVPEQRLRDKMAKNRMWVVNQSSIDLENKKFDYDVIEGPNAVKKTITFDEACHDFGWDSFTLTENKQTIIPSFTIED